MFVFQCVRLGDFCGEYPYRCCGETRCRAYSAFLRKFMRCPSHARNSECICVFDYEQDNSLDDEKMPPTTPEPWDPVGHFYILMKAQGN